MEEVIPGNEHSWGPIIYVRTAVCLFCREDDSAKDKSVLWEQIKDLTNSVPFEKGTVWYAYELKKENFPPLKNEKTHFPSKYNTELIFPQRRIFHLCDYVQMSSWIFNIGTSYALPQTPVQYVLSYTADTAKPHAS